MARAATLTVRIAAVLLAAAAGGYAWWRGQGQAAQESFRTAEVVQGRRVDRDSDRLHPREHQRGFGSKPRTGQGHEDEFEEESPQ